jgi:hypothetical protein
MKAKKAETTNNTAQTSKLVVDHRTNDAGDHEIMIGNLRVVLVPDGGMWFAQGLEIDYAAQGTNIDDAKKCFESGLTSTVEQHLKVYGSISKLLTSAPDEIWKELLFARGAVRHSYSNVTTHQLPFERIDYIERQCA